MKLRAILKRLGQDSYTLDAGGETLLAEVGVNAIGESVHALSSGEYETVSSFHPLEPGDRVLVEVLEEPDAG